MVEARIINGKAFAASLRERVGVKVAAVTETHGLVPGLAVVLVGEDPASQIYVRNKGKMTEAAGMNSWTHRLPAETGQDELVALVDTLNRDDAVNGILVQLPLPDQIDSQVVLEAIDPAKDVDGFHPVNVGRLTSTGPGAESAGLVPCTPLGCLTMLKETVGDLTGLDAVVVGRSNIVGKPMAHLLLTQSCTVTIAHSRTRDLPEVCRGADILIAAVGRTQMIKGDWVKPGAAVIDVGINRVEPEEPGGKDRLVGDVDFAGAAAIAGAITPVPGGVGPMTIACLLRNTLTAACRQAGVAVPE